MSGPASTAATATSGTPSQTPAVSPAAAPTPAPQAAPQPAPAAQPPPAEAPAPEAEVDLLDQLSRREHGMKAYRDQKSAEAASAQRAQGEVAAPAPEAQPAPAEPGGEQEAQPEAQPEPAPPEADGDDLPEKTWNSVVELTRKARETDKRNEALVAENEQLKAQTQEIQTLKSTRDWIDQFKVDPYGALESIGVTYEAWTEYRANGGQPGPTQELQALKARIAQLEGRGQQAEEQQTAEQAKSQRELIAEYAGGVREAMKKPELAALSKFGSVQDVLDYVGLHFQQTKQVLPVEVAATAMNEYFAKQNPDWRPDAPPPVVPATPATPAAPASQGGAPRPAAPAAAPAASPAPQPQSGVQPLRTLDDDTGPTETKSLDLSPEELQDQEIHRQQALARYRANKQG